MSALLERYVDEAVRFVPAPSRHTPAIRIARTLLTCEMAVIALNELQVPEESGPTYRYVNVHNPRCPLSYDPEEGQWRCRTALREHPVWGLNWAAAQLLCRHLGGRLPTAWEWEHFASNNESSRLYPWGNIPPSQMLANYDEHYGGTSAVGSFPPTDIGLYDVAGNLGEWCEDVYEEGVALPLERVVKGGAWSKDARHLRIASSRGKWSRIGTTTIGVRPVWED
jgi:formylglycine-generating enzyme required for sulfatase activity